MKSFAIIFSLVQMLVISQAATANMVNGVAAIVGESVITYKDLQLAMEDDVDFLERRFGNQPEVFRERLAQLEKDRLEQLVEDQLVLQEFKRAGYTVPESFIQNRVNEAIKKYGDRLTLTKTLQAQGLTFESYRARVREGVIKDLMWRQRVPVDPLISPAKIEKYYNQNKDKFKLQDQVKLRMIVITNQPNDAAFSARGVAQEVFTKLKEGVPFDELARIYSQDIHASEGGDRGWIEKPVLREELAEVAFKLNPGEVSEPVEAPGGVYIMKVEETKVSYTRTLAEARDEIESTLRAEEMKRLRKQWIDQLKAKTFISYFLL